MHLNSATQKEKWCKMFYRLFYPRQGNHSWSSVRSDLIRLYFPLVGFCTIVQLHHYNVSTHTTRQLFGGWHQNCCWCKPDCWMAGWLAWPLMVLSVCVSCVMAMVVMARYGLELVCCTAAPRTSVRSNQPRALHTTQCELENINKISENRDKIYQKYQSHINDMYLQNISRIETYHA